MTASGILVCIAFPLLMAYAAVSDLLTMLIPNRVTGAVAVAFVAYAACAGLGLAELAPHLWGGALALAVGFVLFTFGLVGGGDAKLAAATGLWLGLGSLLDYAVVASVFGGVLTLAILAARALPLPGFAVRWPFAVHLHDVKTGVPYGIALAAAALVVLPTSLVWTRMLAV